MGISVTFCEKQPAFPNYFKSENNNKKVILIMGGPGTGKSTIAKCLCTRHGFEFISSQDYALQSNDINTQTNTQALKIRQMILSTGKSIVLIENYPLKQDELNEWKNVIAEHCSVICCIEVSCLEDTMKKRLYDNRKSLGEEYEASCQKVTEYILNERFSLSVILAYITYIRVDTEGQSIEDVMDNVNRELKQIKGVFDTDTNDINIQIK